MMKQMNLHSPRRKTVIATALAFAITGFAFFGSSVSAKTAQPKSAAAMPGTAVTPIKHVVVIFQENVSFDHYFGTYPVAANPAGEPAFVAAKGTPVVNTLATPLDVEHHFARLNVNLLSDNPTRANAENGANAVNPFRLDRSQAATADQHHDYDAEQMAFHDGAMDLFPKSVGVGNSRVPQSLVPPLNTAALVLGYFDGNTVTAYWNYAQHYALNDNAFGTTFGPSNIGAQNLISGQTNGVIQTNAAALQRGGSSLDGDVANDGNGGITVTSDPQPLGDKCTTRDAVAMGGKTIGDLLNAANVTWGFFQGGFDLTVVNRNGSTDCKRTSKSDVNGVTSMDYIPHHEPFQYYASTRNPDHLRPSSAAAIGHSFLADGKTPEPANHQYDIHDFFDALGAGNFPAVSFLKAPAYQDGHSGYSNPLDEQAFVTHIVNTLQKSPEWDSTLVIIAYDDSDGWYDHQMSPIVNPSMLIEGSTADLKSNGVDVAGLGDFLNGRGACNKGMQQGRPLAKVALPGIDGKPNAQGRCGYGPRLPFIVISPYAKTNYVDHTLIDQTSIMRFIEDNWLNGQRIQGSFDQLAGSLNGMLDFKHAPSKATLILDEKTGEPVVAK